MTRSVSRIFATLLAALVVMADAPASHADGLDVTTSTDRVGVGDSFQLTLSADTAGLTQAPDISPLTANFKILGTSRAAQTRIVNGVRSDRLQWVVTLAPKTGGTLAIPSLTAGQATSNPLVIQVLDAADLPAAGAPDGLSINAEIAPGSHYVQQEIPVTVRITTAPGFRGGEIVLPQDNAFMLTQSGADRTSTHTVAGQQVSVIERTYLLRPQISGPLEIPPFTLRAEMESGQTSSPFPRSPFGSAFGGTFGSAFDRMFNPGSLVSRQSAPITINVKPAPDTATGWFLPAKAVTLSADWEPANPTFRVGEAVTRRVRLQALGAAGVQLPDIVMPEAPGLRIYPENSEARTADTPRGTAAQRDFTFSVVPTTGGQVTLPEISVEWFDTGTEQPCRATLPPETITVTGGAAVPPLQAAPAGRAASAQAPSTDGAGAPWTWLPGWVIPAAVAMALAVGLTGFVFFPRGRAATPATDAAGGSRARRKAALHQVEKACRSHDPRTVYPHALGWLSAAVETTGQNRHMILTAVPGLQQSWQHMEESVFSGHAAPSWDAANFLARLKTANRVIARNSARQKKKPAALPGLYPTAVPER